LNQISRCDLIIVEGHDVRRLGCPIANFTVKSRSLSPEPTAVNLLPTGQRSIFQRLGLSGYFFSDERCFDHHTLRIAGCKVFSNEFNATGYVLNGPVEQNVFGIVDVYDL
jgi:hypothetical protein